MFEDISSKAFIAGEKLISVFKVSKNRMALLAVADAADVIKLNHCISRISYDLEPLKI